MIRAVIFDMDGLMIDSEPIQFQAFNAIFKTYGKELPEKEAQHFIGLSDIDTAKDMIERYGLQLVPEELVERKQVVYERVLREQIIPQPGLMELLQQLQSHGLEMAIASGSRLSEIKLVIDTLRIERYFGTYCSAQEVARGKPAPDVFLLAAHRLGVVPQDCLVLEDAPRGIEAAMAAGMKRYAIPSRETKGSDFSHASKVLQSLHEVFDSLQCE